MSERSRSSRSRAALAAGLLLGAYALVLLLGSAASPGTRAVADLGQLAAAAAAAAACAAAARRPGASATSDAGRRAVRRGWGLLAAGCGAWALGQAVWTWHELVAGDAAPFPSVADAGFLAFPVLGAAGLLALPAGRALAGAGRRDLLDGLVIAGSLLVVTWAASLGGIVAAGGGSVLETVLSVAYPVGDVVLLTLVLLVAIRAETARRAVLVPLAAGLSAIAVADSSFLYLSASGSYATGALCDLGWTAGFVLVGLAALAGRDVAAGAGSATGGPSRVRLVLPYLPLLAAQTVITVQLLGGDRRAPRVEVVLGLALVVLVMVRQFLVLADNRALLAEVQAQREDARHQALHDPLTGLANRVLLTDRVEHALAGRERTAGRAAVLFCDLDDFKAVNDRLGHAAGDALLVAVASRLRGCLRPADTVARLGGDEFAVLLEDLDEPPAQVAHRVVTALGAPLELAGEPVTVSVSVGVATDGTGPGPVTGEELLRRADAAMYAAKTQGKARWVVHGERPPGQAAAPPQAGPPEHDDVLGRPGR